MDVLRSLVLRTTTGTKTFPSRPRTKTQLNITVHTSVAHRGSDSSAEESPSEGNKFVLFSLKIKSKLEMLPPTTAADEVFVLL